MRPLTKKEGIFNVKFVIKLQATFKKRYFIITIAIHYYLKLYIHRHAAPLLHTFALPFSPEQLWHPYHYPYRLKKLGNLSLRSGFDLLPNMTKAAIPRDKQSTPPNEPNTAPYGNTFSFLSSAGPSMTEPKLF